MFIKLETFTNKNRDNLPADNCRAEIEDGALILCRAQNNFCKYALAFGDARCYERLCFHPRCMEIVKKTEAIFNPLRSK